MPTSPRTYATQSAAIFFLLIGVALPAVAQQSVSLPGSDAAGSPSVAAGSPDPNARPEKPPTVEQLKARLDALRVELEQEQATLAKRDELNEAEIERLRGQRRELAEQLLTAQIEREKNAHRLKSLREQADVSQNEAAQLLSEGESITAALEDAAQQLRLHLKEIPGSDESVQHLSQAAEALRWSEDAELNGPLANALTEVLAEFDNAHDHATRVTVQPVTIYTAGGEREAVKLLSLGHVRFAYETVDGGRVGLALASPLEASGYRWAENLGGQVETQIREAITAVESKKIGLIALPIDPTGRVQPDMMNRTPGLFEKLRTGGLVMWPLAGLAFVALLLIAERLIVFYGRNGHGDRLAAKVMKACNSGQFERALDICRRGRGAVSRVLAACLERRSFGQRAMEDSIQEQLLHELPRLNRFLGGIATLAAVAPLLGLLGTVTGIIRTFGVIRAFGNANPSLMAGGISEALLTTASGLVIAVPILIVHSILRGRSERIVADAERHAAMLLMSLVHTHSGNVSVGQGSSKERGNGEAVAGDEPSATAPRTFESGKEAAVG